MDLKTVGNKLRLGKYKILKDFIDDLDRIWCNCTTFNKEFCHLFNLAQAMELATKEIFH